MKDHQHDGQKRRYKIEQLAKTGKLRYAAILAQGTELTQPRFLVNIIDDDGNECLRWLTAIPRKGEYIDAGWWRKSDEERDASYQVVGVHHCPADDWINEPHVALDVVWRSEGEKFYDTFGSHMMTPKKYREREMTPPRT
jgi:hypothetical protein